MSQTVQRDTETYVGTESLTDGEYYRLMAVRRRRTTLAALAELGAPVDLDELATAVSKRERESPAADEATIDRIAVRLHHLHLPKMDALGVLDYDHNANRVIAAD